MARILTPQLASASGRSNPLNNTREPRMGPLAVIPLAAAALFALGGWILQAKVQEQRIQAVAEAVVASGLKGPVDVQPMVGEECWRAREGFSWRTREASGWACAGPGGEVRLKDLSRSPPPPGSSG